MNEAFPNAAALRLASKSDRSVKPAANQKPPLYVLGRFLICEDLERRARFFAIFDRQKFALRNPILGMVGLSNMLACPENRIYFQKSKLNQLFLGN
jgi:hypothetical protein